MTTIINENIIANREKWVKKIKGAKGDFDSKSTLVQKELSEEISNDGVTALLGHLRLCSAIPEYYEHDSSEEKLYAKYTDALISEVFLYIGLDSNVLKERADTADVLAQCENFSFVADAKVFRLSRTAKNQKDFKVQAMDGWRGKSDYALVVCPSYQLPSKTSQIYEQAANRNVCILSYSHLAILVQMVQHGKQDTIISLLHDIFESVKSMTANKNARLYWEKINATIRDCTSVANIETILETEKHATIESIKILKEEALLYFNSEMKRINGMSHQEALKELLKMHKLDNRVQKIAGLSNNTIILN